MFYVCKAWPKKGNMCQKSQDTKKLKEVQKC